MNRKISLFIIFFILSTQLKAQNFLPQVVSGKIERLENFQSKYITARNIDIWLPNGYSDTTKYAVLYMHDGQMLYDPAQCWNKQAWNVDDVASELLAKNKTKNFIVIGIWNGAQTRHQDYFPQKPFEQLSQTEKDTVVAQLQRAGKTTGNFQPQSDKYLQFIVKELKPYIDKKYAVKTNRENTFIAGSSMGGLISLYAICEYPKIFGGAACLSTHWVGTFTLENNPVPNSLIKYLKNKLPNHKNHKIYFDCGDQTLDAMYPNIQMKVDNVIKSKGYAKKNWITKYFPGDDHSEKSWNKRLNIPIEFLLKK
ncbi:MAG: alpha/beta hydrolase [Saprospiraceae bacterium]|nr:alpha/beta hydrolase [Saprospiraceae bacterium]